jgi:hypothetical protein
MAAIDPITVIAIWLVLAGTCALVARFKNKSALAWFGWGIMFGAVALGYLLLTPGE